MYLNSHSPVTFFFFKSTDSPNQCIPGIKIDLKPGWVIAWLVECCSANTKSWDSTLGTYKTGCGGICLLSQHWWGRGTIGSSKSSSATQQVPDQLGLHETLSEKKIKQQENHQNIPIFNDFKSTEKYLIQPVTSNPLLCLCTKLSNWCQAKL